MLTFGKELLLSLRNGHKILPVVKPYQFISEIKTLAPKDRGDASKHIHIYLLFARKPNIAVSVCLRLVSNRQTILKKSFSPEFCNLKVTQLLIR